MLDSTVAPVCGIAAIHVAESPPATTKTPGCVETRRFDVANRRVQRRSVALRVDVRRFEAVNRRIQRLVFVMCMEMRRFEAVNRRIQRLGCVLAALSLHTGRVIPFVPGISSMTPQWIWQHTSWPDFGYSSEQLRPVLQEVSRRAESLLVRLGGPEVDDIAKLQLDTLVQNLLKTSQIEGEQLDVASVRSSLIRRLKPSAVPPSMTQPTVQSDSLATLVDEYTSARPEGESLDEERVFRWHRLLFAGSASPHVRPGGWRQGPDAMQVVSQKSGREVVHYEAPPASAVASEMEQFLDWFWVSAQHLNAAENGDLDENPWIRAAIVHFWFVTIHPFDDGNGRMARALSDHALAEYSPVLSRLLAIPASIQVRRRDYYTVLEHVQRGSPADISPFLLLWLECVIHAFGRVETTLNRVVRRTRFWRRWRESGLLAPQIKLLHRMLDDRDDHFPQGIQAGEYSRLCRVDKATATRHLADLTQRGILEQVGAGRSTRYVLRESRGLED